MLIGGAPGGGAVDCSWDTFLNKISRASGAMARSGLSTQPRADD